MSRHPALSYDDDTHTALGRGQESAPETEVVVDSTKTQAEALAWSAGDTDEVVPYSEHRSLLYRLGPAAAMVLALVAAGATVTLFVGRDKPAPPGPAAHPAPPPPPRGPIDGTYRIDHYRGEGVIRMPDGYTTSADAETSTVATEWWALQSHCGPNSCTATGTRLDDNTHQAAAIKGTPNLPAGETTQTLQLINGQWQSTSRNTIKQECASSHDQETWRWSLELYPLPDGTLKGQEIDVIESNECRTIGKTVKTPTVATRVGDLPPGLPPLNAK